MKKIVWLFLLGIFACTPKTKIVEVKNDAGNVIEKYTINIEKEVKEGKSEVFSSSGQLFETAFYKNGQLHGERTLFHENGAIQAIEQYENGQFATIYKAFYDNEQLELEGKYVSGNMDGEWKRYYDSGELMEIVTFAENEENGPFVEYYKNGNQKAVGNYLSGDNEHGELLLFDEAGALIKKMNCTGGICRTSWTKEAGEKKI